MLDGFEGREYEHRGVALADGTEARTYAWLDGGGCAVLAHDWDAESYADRVLATYGSAARRP